MNLLSAIVAWSLRNRALVLVATLLFIVVGVRAALQLPIDAVPDVTNVQVQIITAAPALSPVEVEQYISIPVERAMSGLPKMTQVRSVSQRSPAPGQPQASRASRCTACTVAA